MRIVGFSIDKISAERKSSAKGKLEIKSNIDIKDIQKEEVSFSDKQALKFSFEFTIDYNPKVAHLEIIGSIIALDENDESKNILKEWKKKKFAHPIKLPLFNFIMDKCNLKALLLEEELGLPMHIPLPKLRLQQNQLQPGSQQKSNPANYTG